MARVAIVFGIMLSPVFLFFILFEKTNALFWQWVKYLLSIFFAMAALSIVAVIALQAAAFALYAVAMAGHSGAKAVWSDTLSSAPAAAP